jgi:alpha-amylase
MIPVCFYFQVHQPFRLRPDFDFFAIGSDRPFEDDAKNRGIMRKVAEKCYLPTNRLMLETIRRWEGKFRISYSISGVALEQMELYAPDVLRSFQDLVATGCVELVNETYYHSLAFLYSREEWKKQVMSHRRKLWDLFGVTPKTFRNTELIYNNDVAREAEALGFSTILAEGADRVLGWRSPNFVYSPAGTHKIALLLKNYRLSDDIAFRFGNKGWDGWPLTTDKFAEWVHRIAGNGETVNFFMDYETFGEHQWADTGIFDFMRHLPEAIMRHPDFCFQTPHEVTRTHQPVAKLDVPHFVSWADVERDLTAWLGNPLQDSAGEFIYALEREVMATNDIHLIHTWRKLQTSDHFYYMCTKFFADGDVHKYFNPYKTPYDAFVLYCNAVNQLKETLRRRREDQREVVTSPSLAQRWGVAPSSAEMSVTH